MALYLALLGWLFELGFLEVIVLAVVLYVVRLAAFYAAELVAGGLFLGGGA